MAHRVTVGPINEKEETVKEREREEERKPGERKM